MVHTHLRPYILSRVDWQNPRNDPIFRQFLPLKSMMLPDHPKLTLDSLHEEADSPVSGLVHRYPDKALFLRKHLKPFEPICGSPLVDRLLVITDCS